MLTHLPARGVIEVAGTDRVAFLQGLVSNDVAQAAPGRAVWAALLTPQGKYIADFFILDAGDRLLLDCEAAEVAGLVPRLARFRMRADATVSDASAAWHVHVAWGSMPEVAADVLVAPDPRLAQAGWRLLAPAVLATTAAPADWNAHRLSLGLPDGSADLEPGRTILLEAGFDELHGVSWTKGCYMGQELTARTKYRGLIKRRLVPVDAEGALPAPGTAVTADGAEVGTLHGGQDGRALATVRLDAFDRVLTCGGTRLMVRRPDWLVVPS